MRFFPTSMLKPVSSMEEDVEYQKYLEPDEDTYSPFAALLKDEPKKKKKKKQ